MSDDVIHFAIGDVHGESGKLHELHQAILERIVFEKQPAHVVHLGDYVDRGRDSRGVIEAVMAFEDRHRDSKVIRVSSLMGNHEEMMLQAYDADPSQDVGGWWTQGGLETVASYVEGEPDTTWREAIPKSHIAWMRALPSMVRDEERKLAFVHAGIDPAVFPNCREYVRMWTRSDRFFDAARWPDRSELAGLMVVHGHTPKSFDPEVFPHRINVDTGAVFGGPLTAVMLKSGAPPQFLRAS